MSLSLLRSDAGDVGVLSIAPRSWMRKRAMYESPPFPGKAGLGRWRLGACVPAPTGHPVVDPDLYPDGDCSVGASRACMQQANTARYRVSSTTGAARCAAMVEYCGFSEADSGDAAFTVARSASRDGRRTGAARAPRRSATGAVVPVVVTRSSGTEVPSPAPGTASPGVAPVAGGAGVAAPGLTIMLEASSDPSALSDAGGVGVARRTI